MLEAIHKTLFPAALALLTIVAPLAVLADESDVFNFSVGHTITYDDNLFRISPDAAPPLNGSERSDVINTTFAGVNVDKIISRQHFLLAATASHSRFSNYDQLDYDGRDITGRWLWEMGKPWKGELSVQDTRRLSSFTDLQQRNVVDYRRYYGSARYEFHPDWSVVGGLSRVENSNSAATQRPSDYTANAVEAGVRYSPISTNQVDLKVRRTEGRYPNRQVVNLSTVDNSYTQDELELSALWHPTGEGTFNGRIGLTQRKHNQLSQRDFRGPTGRLSYDWNVTAKTLLNAALWREIWVADDVNASYVLSKGVSFSPSYQATSKIQLQARMQYVERDHRGDPGIVLSNTPQQQDEIKTGSVTASYQAMRSLRLSVTYQTERRDSNIKRLEYTDNLTFVSGQFTF